LRLVVEQVHLRGGAGLEEVDDPFGLGGEVGQAWRPACGFVACRGEELVVEQRGQGGDANPRGAAAEEVAAGEEQLVFEQGSHGWRSLRTGSGETGAAASSTPSGRGP